MFFLKESYKNSNIRNFEKLDRFKLALLIIVKKYLYYVLDVDRNINRMLFTDNPL